MTRKPLLALFAVLLALPLLVYARGPLPGAVLDYDNGSMTGGAAVNTSSYTASWPGVLRIQFANDAGGSDATAEVVLDGATYDLGSVVAAGDAAAYLWLVNTGDSLDFQVDTTTTGSLKVFDLGQGQ